MRHMELQHLKKSFGSFIQAGLIYIIGVVLFSLWSYSGHRNALLTHTDRSLIDAAVSMQEILTEEFLIELSTGIEKNTQSFIRKQNGLSRMANHGNFNFYGVVKISEGKITPLIAGTDDPLARVENNTPAPILSNHIQTHLLDLAEAGKDESNLYVGKHSKAPFLRYAILYKAQNKGNGLALLVSQKNNVVHHELTDLILQLSIAGLTMVALTIPLILIFSQCQRKTAKERSDMNARLQRDIKLQAIREEELKDAINELKRFNAVTVGRESRIIELKTEVNTLLEKLNREKRYTIEKSTNT